MARLVVSPETQADLDEILRWLAREAGRPVALRYAEKFGAAFRHLTTFPETGARRSKLGRDMRI
jgi:plasmid stabilization system protein ParE